jgi:hypothetical protein
MAEQKKITDRKSLKKNRTRVLKSKRGYFALHKIAIKEIEERLQDINRSFQKIAIITAYPKIWTSLFPDAFFLNDSDTLDFGLEKYDLIIHAMSLHWSDDPVGQLIQCKNMLIKDGLFLAVFFGGKTIHELNYSFSKAEAKISEGISPRFMPMGEIRDLGNLLQRAGFGLPVADSISKKYSYKSILTLMHDIRRMGETNVLLLRKKTFTQSKIINEMIKIYSENFKQRDNTFLATFELIFLTGWAPSDNQPKPLRPGSVKVNLSKLLDDFIK